MTFILADQRHTYEQVTASFLRYRKYLAENRTNFPPGALELAASEWYYDPKDRRCPHDAWLDSVAITESASSGKDGRTVAIRVRLLGAYHDGYIEFFYPRVYRYHFALEDAAGSHRDWRYDEFRLSETGHLLHEIEWNGPQAVGRWLIEASDVVHAWHPNTSTGGPAT